MSLGHVLRLFWVGTSCSELDSANGLSEPEFPGHFDGSLEGWLVGILSSPENPEPDLDNYYTEDSYSMPDSEIEELIDTHGGYSAEMAFFTISPSVLLLPMGL